MFVVLVKNKVKLEEKEKYIKVSKKFAQDMKQVTGCLDACVWESKEQSDCVVNYELWQDEESYLAQDHEIFSRYKQDLKKGFLSNISETYKIS